MKNQKTRTQNRLYILLNTCSLLAGIILLYIVSKNSWPNSYLLLEFALAGIFIFTFIKAFVITNSWKLIHSSTKLLDERELELVLSATRTAYSIFAIICIITIYILTIGNGFEAIDIVIASGLLYLAHILPAMIITWNQRVIKEELSS